MTVQIQKTNALNRKTINQGTTKQVSKMLPFGSVTGRRILGRQRAKLSRLSFVASFINCPLYIVLDFKHEFVLKTFKKNPSFEAKFKQVSSTNYYWWFLEEQK